MSGEPSIGASGMVYAIEGYLMMIYRLDAERIPYVLEQAFFALANNDAGIDHWAQLGGFCYLQRLVLLYLSQEWFNFYYSKVTCF